MTIQEIISNLVENRWSYGDVAKQAGVSKATISRWHKGQCKPNKALEEIVKINLKNKLDFKDIDIENANLVFVNGVELPSWKEVREEVFNDDYYKKAISYHKEVISKLEKARDAKKWQFTEDEKAILRNLPKKYKWIARSKVCQILSVFEGKPFKDDEYWKEKKFCSSGSFLVFGITGMNLFSHLFQCIQWEDDEPCEFRKFI